MTKNQSVFTSLPEIKDRTIIENDTAFAFLTNTPINPGHTLVSPKRVVATNDELTDKELLDIFELVSRVKKVLKKVYGAEGFNCAWNEGKDYGQSVPHFHLHIVPRTQNDNGIEEYEPRKFLYRPGSRQETTESELAKTAKEIGAQL